MSNTRIPFGKHQGKTLKSLETRYLLWLASQSFMAKKYPEILEEMIDLIILRLRSGAHGLYITAPMAKEAHHEAD